MGIGNASQDRILSGSTRQILRVQLLQALRRIPIRDYHAPLRASLDDDDEQSPVEDLVNPGNSKKCGRGNQLLATVWASSFLCLVSSISSKVPPSCAAGGNGLPATAVISAPFLPRGLTSDIDPRPAWFVQGEVLRASSFSPP